MKLVAGTDPVLRSGTDPFDFTAPTVDPAQLYKDLSEMMLSLSGLGLSAVQVGVPVRFFVMRTNPVIGVFNPRILEEHEDTETLDEACLSFPGLVLPITRSKFIRVRYEEPNGQTVTKSFGNLSARCFLHELDHCDGILFYNRATRFHRDRALQRQKITLRRQKQNLRSAPAKKSDVILEWKEGDSLVAY